MFFLISLVPILLCSTLASQGKLLGLCLNKLF